MVSGESQPKLPCVHSGGLWRPTKALRTGPLGLVVTQHALDHPLACLAVAGRRSYSVRHDWARRPHGGGSPGPRSSICDIQRLKNIPGSSPLTPAKGALGPPKGGLKGAAVRGVPLSSTAASEALAGDACPAGRGYNEARAVGFQ
jgi:hypothetical protein